nr:RNA-directed DNA polymerase, eukaryota, reverse transcriptase zinc-binding domain protein [Tanacetum cinerariifolium]
DAVFIGEWSIENLDNLLKILNCFHLASGLCINVNKSHVLGVGVPLDIVRQGALRIGCEVMQTPFKYFELWIVKLHGLRGRRRHVRDGVERNQWSALLYMLGTITLSSSPDRYFCDLNGDGAYRVKDIRSELDDLFLPSSAVRLAC